MTALRFTTARPTSTPATRDFKLIVDRKTIFVDVNGEVAYTGYDEVPNVENAEIAYVLDGDNNEKADGKIAEVVFILDGEIYDDNAHLFRPGRHRPRVRRL